MAVAKMAWWSASRTSLTTQVATCLGGATVAHREGSSMLTLDWMGCLMLCCCVLVWKEKRCRCWT